MDDSEDWATKILAACGVGSETPKELGLQLSPDRKSS